MKLSFKKFIDFIKEKKGQAFTELIILITLIFMTAIVATIHLGLFQLSRTRIQMANFYLGHTSATAKNPGDVGTKTKVMLKKGAPSVVEDSTWFESVTPTVSGGDAKTAQIKTEFRLNSSIMQKVVGSDIMPLNSYKLYIKGPKYK
ncbi:MAG: hypothetical protein KKH98_08975 [Spirochaetes bacterium]|nr:hypothetical protein [Spirochaetota bacterium]